jgi:hypothetical protein
MSPTNRLRMTAVISQMVPKDALEDTDDDEKEKNAVDMVVV